LSNYSRAVRAPRLERQRLLNPVLAVPCEQRRVRLIAQRCPVTSAGCGPRGRSRRGVASGARDVCLDGTFESSLEALLRASAAQDSRSRRDVASQYCSPSYSIAHVGLLDQGQTGQSQTIWRSRTDFSCDGQQARTVHRFLSSEGSKTRIDLIQRRATYICKDRHRGSPRQTPAHPPSRHRSSHPSTGLASERAMVEKRTIRLRQEETNGQSKASRKGANSAVLTEVLPSLHHGPWQRKQSSLIALDNTIFRLPCRPPSED
jgi:hypothetical protein